MIAAGLLLLPLLFTFIILMMSASNSRTIALIGALCNLALVFYGWMQFDSGTVAELSFNHSWIPSLGIQFQLGIDGISMLLVLLTGFLYPFIIASTAQSKIKNPKSFYALMLMMQLGLLGVFMAGDAFLFYVFYELTLIPVYFICAIWGGERSIPITLKFFIYTLAGSLFMLIAIIYLYFKTPGIHTFNIESFYHLSLSASEQNWIFWAFFLAFAVKIPIFPFHTWQPDTYTVAPAAGSMLLAGIMLKMGIYGLIRLLLPIVPDGVAVWGNTVLVLCIIGIVYASLIAWRQQDLKRLIAYSSMAHVGLIAAGVFALNISGLQGAMIQMFNHGVNVVAIFFLVDIIEKRYGTRWINELGGIAGQMKRFGVIFMIVMLGSIGLPLTNGFIGEFLLLMGLFTHNAWMAAFAGLTLILGAVYMFRLYRNVFLGEWKVHKASPVDTVAWENYLLIPLCCMVVLLGVYPSILLNISAPAIQHILDIVYDANTMVSGL